MRLSERGMINNCNICWFLFSLFITVTAGFSCLGQGCWSPPLRSHQQPCGCDSHIPTGVTHSAHSSRRSSAPMDLIPPAQRVLRRNFPEGNAGRLKRRGSERECVCTRVWVPACVCGCCCSARQWCWRSTGGPDHREPSGCCQKEDLRHKKSLESLKQGWKD